MKSFEELGINVDETREQQKTLCPKCSESRKKKYEPCLSVNTSTGMFHCHNCGYRGCTKVTSIPESYTAQDWDVPVETEFELTEPVIDYFRDRGISELTLRTNFIGEGTGKYENYVAFPYIKDEVVNVKYRAIDEKAFFLEPECEVCFYGISTLFHEGSLVTDNLIICEGEIDKLSLYEAGFTYCISLPNGAGVEEEGRPKTTPRMDYLEDPDIVAILNNISKVTIFTDEDYKGQRIKEELANRIGLEKCYEVSPPKDCKDANDVLMKYGIDGVMDVIHNAKPMLKGLLTVDDLEEKLNSFYSSGFTKGKDSGIDDFDEICTLSEGFLYLMTGTPESLKTTVIDNICVGYAKNHGIHTAVFSPETPSLYHVSKLVSIYSGETVGSPESEDRISYTKFKEAYNWVGKHFTFINPVEYKLETIIELAKISILQNGTKIVVIDPFSMLSRDGYLGDEIGFSKHVLSLLRKLAKEYNVAVMLVAHPRKMDLVSEKGRDKVEQKDYKVPQPYDIAGCYDSKTEFLSRDGWKYHSDYVEGEEIAVFDKDTGIMSWEVPSKTHKYPYKGYLKHFKSKNQNILVTPNHNMVAKYLNKNCNQNWRFIRADDWTKSQTLVRYSLSQVYGNNPITMPEFDGDLYLEEDIARIIGWYVSEGHETMGSFSFCQAEGQLSFDMKETLDRMRLNYSLKKEKPRGKGKQTVWKFRIYKSKGHKQLCEYIINNCGKGFINKKLPRSTWKKSYIYKRVLLNSLIEGDGCTDGKGNMKYFTCSNQLADDVQRLCLELGYGTVCSKTKGRKKGHSDLYTIYISRDSREVTELNLNRHVSDRYYDGYVYCFTTSTGAYITRRNGRVAFQGNTADFFNSPDIILVSWRSKLRENSPLHVAVLKSKFWHLASSGGKCILDYDLDTWKLSSTKEKVKRLKRTRRKNLTNRAE